MTRGAIRANGLELALVAFANAGSGLRVTVPILRFAHQHLERQIILRGEVGWTAHQNIGTQSTTTEAKRRSRGMKSNLSSRMNW